MTRCTVHVGVVAPPGLLETFREPWTLSAALAPLWMLRRALTHRWTPQPVLARNHEPHGGCFSPMQTMYYIELDVHKCTVRMVGTIRAEGICNRPTSMHARKLNVNGSLRGTCNPVVQTNIHINNLFAFTSPGYLNSSLNIEAVKRETPRTNNQANESC